MDSQTNAEAGPSRTKPPSFDSTRTPPTTPGRDKPKRRSWFGFASPSNLLTPTAGSVRRKSKDEEVELVETEGKGQGSRKSSLDASRTAEPGQMAAKHVLSDPDREGQEVLSIDGQPEETVKKKTNKRRSLTNGDEGEVVRMADLSGLSRRRSLTRTAHDPGGENLATTLESTGQFPSRSFVRTASDRDVFTSPADIIHYNAPTLSSPISTFSQATPATQTSLFFTPSNRPLPPLPPGDSDKALPQVPRGIVVTPSSPHKLVKRNPSRPVGASASLQAGSYHSGKSRSQSRSRSRDPSQRRLRNVKSFNLGLGRPKPGQNDKDDASFLPGKAQSVSSPLPSRSSSPTPKIAFAEPEIDRSGAKPVAGADAPESGDTERRGRARRARSLSGVLSRPKVASRSNSRAPTPEPEASDEITVRASGVLGWFGVKKTVKRRPSETKLTDLGAPEGITGTGNASSPRISLSSRGGGSGESLREIGAPSSRQESLPLSTSTNEEQRSQSKDVFGRRSSSRNSGSRGQSPAGKGRPSPITILPRSSFASSRSSFQSTYRDPISPVSEKPNDWESGGAHGEGEETLFSPDSGSHWGPGIRPWMDGTESRRSAASPVIAASPLSSLPEQTVLATPLPVPEQGEGAHVGRLRSWSDAPLPQTAVARSLNGPKPASSQDNAASRSMQGTPNLAARPKLPSRSSSGNSVLMGKMRSVFSKTSRDHTLVRQPSSDIDEFGTVKPRAGWPRATTMRPSSSSSSILGPGTVRPTSIDHDTSRLASLSVSEAERAIFLGDTPERSPRTSIAGASMNSVQSISSRSSRPEPPATLPKNRAGRARASTMFSRPASSFIAPPSPQVVPVAATPPRRRPSMISRLSNGVLRSGQSSPRGGLFPLPPKSSGSGNSGAASPRGPDDISSALSSPRPSAGSIAAAMGTTSLKAMAVREEGDTPEIWLERVQQRVGRNDIANILAASGDEFHAEALKLYMAHFDFTHNALDVALRRLLTHMSLPRETQQIDRVIEAFAVRYEECEPGLFTSKDNTYVLAFSMMMLHTDAFNRHNKNKMTKGDYVRNTRMEGVHPLVLEAFFDNITFTPFVFVEDESDFGREPLTASTYNTVSSSALTSAPKNGKIDVYHMIVDDTLGSLRIDMEAEIPSESSLTCIGTRKELDTDTSNRAFVEAKSMIIVPPKRKNSAAGLLGNTPSKSRDAAPNHEMTLKVTKVGLLSRRDEVVDTKKVRKWKSWSVILTGSQLLFFKDPSWALTLLERINTPPVDGVHKELLPKATNFKPDEVFPLSEAIAVYDKANERASNTFRFVLPGLRQYLLQATNEAEMNEWINLINYASTFKTAGIRIRGTSMGKDRAALAGAAAAASHKRDMRLPAEATASLPRTPRKAVFGDNENTTRPPTPILERPTTGTLPSKSKGLVDVDGANDTLDEGDRLEEVFDVVKAELAAGRGGAPLKLEKPRAQRGTEHTSRADAIQAKLNNFTTKARAHQTALATNLRIVRNLAILTPFQRSTKDRIASAVPALASKIFNIRLDIAKYSIWIEILRRELIHEQREMARLRHVALQAAAKSLRDPLGVQGVLQDVNSDDPGVPVLALPSPDEHGNEEPRESGESGSRSSAEMMGRSPGELPVIIRPPSGQSDRRGREGRHRPEISRQTSLQSYKSIDSNGHDEIRRNSSSFLSARDDLSRPETPRDESETGRSTPVLFALSDGEDERTIQNHQTTMNGGSLGIDISGREGRQSHGHSQSQDVGNGGNDGATEYDVDMPEEWIKTRAARRVSLANIPDIPIRSSSHRHRTEGQGR